MPNPAGAELAVAAGARGGGRGRADGLPGLAADAAGDPGAGAAAAAAISTRAEAAATQAAALAVEIKEPGAEAYATGLLGEVALRRGEAGPRRLAVPRRARTRPSRSGWPLAACVRQRLEDPDNRAHPWLDGVALAP